MSPFYAFLIALHLILCLVLIVLVLLQNDKSGGIGAGLGSMGGGAFTSGGAASFITRLTTGVAISFMVLVFIMNIYQPHPEGVNQSEGVLQKAAKTLTAVPTQAPVAPAAAPQAQPAK